MSDSNYAYQTHSLVRARLGTGVPHDGPAAYRRVDYKPQPAHSVYRLLFRQGAWMLVASVFSFILLTLQHRPPLVNAAGMRPIPPPELIAEEVPIRRLIAQAPGLIEQRDSELRIFHVVRKGQTFSSIFSDYGLEVMDAALVQQQLNQATEDDKEIKPLLDAGQRLIIVLGLDGELQSISAELRRDTVFKLARRADGIFAGALQELPKALAERVILGEIISSFSSAAREAGASLDAVDDFVDLFGDRVSFHKDFRPGDRFSVVYQDTELADGTSLGEGAILAAAITAGGKQHYAIRYIGSDGVARYFDETGQVLGDTFLRYPLKFSRISSHFSQARFHPVLKVQRPHNGVDFAAPSGTPVRAVADGTVAIAALRGGSGLMVKLQHGARYSTAYLHLSSIASGVQQGGAVRRGQVIGAVGMTGLATGPHLHFSFYDRDTYVDPLSTKLPHAEDLNPSQRIDRTYLQRVLFTLNHYQRLDSHEIYASGSKKIGSFPDDAGND